MMLLGAYCCCGRRAVIKHFTFGPQLSVGAHAEDLWSCYPSRWCLHILPLAKFCAAALSWRLLHFDCQLIDLTRRGLVVRGL
jgi:hypothetical protein